MFHAVKNLSRWFDITLLSLSEQPDTQDLGPVPNWCENVIIVGGHMRRELAAVKSAISLKPYRVVRFWSPNFQKACDKALSDIDFDILWVNFSNMMAYVRPSFSLPSFVVLDEHSSQESVWTRYAKQGKLAHRLFARWNLFKERRFQQRVLKHVDAFLSVSEDEADFIRQRASSTVKVWTVPNGVDTTSFQSSFSDSVRNNIVLFCGSLDVTMNVDAVTRFAHNVFPHIRNGVEDAELWIVGRNPRKAMTKLAGLDGVVLIGGVPDVRPYYDQAKVSVAPFRFGAGTKLKILESMAMGVPVVSTSDGCKGIYVEGTKGIYLADDDTSFAQTVIRVLRGDGLDAATRASARGFVVDKYDWASIYDDVGDRLTKEVMYRNMAGGTRI